GRYYLYQVSSYWDKNKKCTRKVTGKMVGRITEKDGLIPRGTKNPSKMRLILQNITSKEYGASAVVQQISADIVNPLQEFFPQFWSELFILAMNRLLYQAP